MYVRGVWSKNDELLSLEAVRRHVRGTFELQQEGGSEASHMKSFFAQYTQFLSCRIAITLSPSSAPTAISCYGFMQLFRPPLADLSLLFPFLSVLAASTESLHEEEATFTLHGYSSLLPSKWRLCQLLFCFCSLLHLFDRLCKCVSERSERSRTLCHTRQAHDFLNAQ